MQSVKYNKVNDSGKRREFATGSVRDIRDGKGRFDLVSPIALRRLAQHYENGAKKYGDRNWEKGQPISQYLDSAIRHLYSFLGGDRSEDHLSAVAWNVFAYIHTLERVQEGKLPAELNDMGEPCPDQSSQLKARTSSTRSPRQSKQRVGTAVRRARK